MTQLEEQLYDAFTLDHAKSTMVNVLNKAIALIAKEKNITVDVKILQKLIPELHTSIDHLNKAIEATRPNAYNAMIDDYPTVSDNLTAGNGRSTIIPTKSN